MRQDVSFLPVGSDTCSRIPADSIVFRKTSVKLTSQNQGFTFDPVFPGIIVSTPFEEAFNPSAGEVAHDEYVYHWLIQIIDSDNREPEANIRSYWKWQEQIRRLFQFNCLANVDAYKVLAKAVNVDVVDENKWLKDDNFVCGVHVAVQVWETRGPTT